MLKKELDWRLLLLVLVAALVASSLPVILIVSRFVE